MASNFGFVHKTTKIYHNDFARRCCNFESQIEKKGLDNVSRHSRESLDQWRDEHVQLAVTGASGSGKSSFINLIRNVRPGDNGFAKSSPHDNTTKIPTKYDFPGNPLIKVFDLPGFGTIQQTLDEYETIMNLRNYDYFCIFIKHVEENDIKLAKKLKELKKPFCFVRSKFDQNLANCEDYHDVQYTLMDDIKLNTFDILERAQLTDTLLVVISSKDQSIGEFDKLVVHFENSLSNRKREVVIFSPLGILTTDMIERKYQELKKRVLLRAVGTAGCAFVPVPGADFISTSLVLSEIRHYRATFGFDQELVKETAALVGVKEKVHKNSLIMIANNSEADLFLIELGTSVAIQSASYILPVVGVILSACTAGIGTYQFLNRLLDICKDDAKAVYSHLLMDKANVRGITEHSTIQEDDRNRTNDTVKQ